jgi:hypothetical protein
MKQITPAALCRALKKVHNHICKDIAQWMLQHGCCVLTHSTAPGATVSCWCDKFRVDRPAFNDFVYLLFRPTAPLIRSRPTRAASRPLRNRFSSLGGLTRHNTAPCSRGLARVPSALLCSSGGRLARQARVGPSSSGAQRGAHRCANRIRERGGVQHCRLAWRGHEHTRSATTAGAPAHTATAAPGPAPAPPQARSLRGSRGGEARTAPARTGRAAGGQRF